MHILFMVTAILLANSKCVDVVDVYRMQWMDEHGSHASVVKRALPSVIHGKTRSDPKDVKLNRVLFFLVMS